MGFPLVFAFALGGSTYEPALASIEGTELAWIESHCDEGQRLLLQQFREKPRLTAVLCALLSGVQDADDAAWAVLIGRNLELSVGAQLEGIGQIVDLAKSGWDEETYRTLLRVQVLVLRSSSTSPDLCGILSTMGFDLELVTMTERYPLGLDIEVSEPPLETTGASAEDLFGLLDRARAETVRLIFFYPLEALEETFAWVDDDAATANVADAARGWADDGVTLGGYFADASASTEAL